MRKKILLIDLICLFLFFLNSCGEDFIPIKEKESFEFYPIETTVNDISTFISDIESFANTLEQDLILGAVRVTIDRNFDYKVIFEFSKAAMLVNLTYNPVKNGIEYMQRITGPAQLYPPSAPLDYSHWKMNFAEGIQRLQEELLEKDIQTFDQIICTCYIKAWTYRGYADKEDPSSDIFLITVNP